MGEMSLDLFSIGFGRPDLLREQVRLINKYLSDPFGFCLIDNTPDPVAAHMEAACRDLGVGYLHVPSKKHLHNDALNFAAAHAIKVGSEYFGFLDHDVFPCRATSLLSKVIERGFYGVGQRHAPTGNLYLWPGFCFFSRKWLGVRRLNFDGIKADYRRDDGDCGSMNWPLFSDEDWRDMHSMEHGYKTIRKPDDYGLQSWGVEILGDWLHLTNGSNWMDVPEPEERDRLLLEMVGAL